MNIRTISFSSLGQSLPAVKGVSVNFRLPLKVSLYCSVFYSIFLAKDHSDELLTAG